MMLEEAVLEVLYKHCECRSQHVCFHCLEQATDLATRVERYGDARNRQGMQHVHDLDRGKPGCAYEPMEPGYTAPAVAAFIGDTPKEKT